MVHRNLIAKFCFKIARLYFGSNRNYADDQRIARTLSVRKLAHFLSSKPKENYKLWEVLKKQDLRKSKRSPISTSTDVMSLVKFIPTIRIWKVPVGLCRSDPEQCQFSEEDDHGGIQFEIYGHRITIGLCAE